MQDMLVGRFVFGIFCLSFVLDISDVTVIISPVGNDLLAAIGEQDEVRSSDNFAIASLLVSEIVVAGLILHGPVEAYRPRDL